MFGRAALTVVAVLTIGILCQDYNKSNALHT